MADPVLVAGSGRDTGRAWRFVLPGGYDIALHCRTGKNAAEEAKSVTGGLGRLARILRFGGFFMSKEASYITRQTISVNGGLFSEKARSRDR